ncbi:MAG TPA: hypothetical protein VMV49_07070 [Candidatus Deferrimicrobium sp.]|nr:hypothetical protein [Candidatus Deferrimicrobium sp.]
MLKWLFVIDPLDKIDPSTDTTYVIMKESCSRKIEVFYCTITDLYVEQVVGCLAKKIFFSEGIEVKSPNNMVLDDFDLIFMRKDPPYDINYHYATQLLSLTKSKVINAPESLRRFNEKLIIFHFPNLIPPTIVTSNRTTVESFLDRYGVVVMKSLESYQGKQVQKIEKKGDIPDLITPVMIQQSLPNITKGDKRVLILGDKFLGAVNRIPKQGFISNFGAGGVGIKTELTANEMKIVELVGPFLQQHQIHFAGLDLIDGYLTEINITCPTGLQQINRLENKKLETEVVDYFLNCNYFKANL